VAPLPPNSYAKSAMPDSDAYVDTSVLAAYYCPEPLSSAAEAALRGIDTPVISNLTLVEFSSLIARKRRLKELGARQATEVLHLFRGHTAEGLYRRITLGAEHFIQAQSLIETMTISLRTLDALHLSVAMKENLPILTADRELASAAKRLKVRAILIA
jgi:predicted nucleic acid-binding protein